MYHMMRLCEEGWATLPDDGPLSFRMGEELQCQLILSKPVSYFVALASHNEIFAKGVAEIKHDMPDGYFRCLLTLPAAKLQSLLDDMANKSNERFMGELRELQLQDGDANAVDDSSGGGVPLASCELPALPPVHAPIVAGADWERCWVSMGSGTVEYNIYFDNCTGGAGVRRGFTNSPLFNVINTSLVSLATGSSVQRCGYGASVDRCVARETSICYFGLRRKL